MSFLGFIDGPSKVAWTQESTSQLIKLYKAHPVLYKNKDDNYKNQHKRLAALKAIRQVFLQRGKDFSVEDLKRKIHGLRTQYSRQLKKIKTLQLSGEDEYVPRLWCFSHLDFLRNSYVVKAEDMLEEIQDESTVWDNEETQETPNIDIVKHEEPRPYYLSEESSNYEGNSQDTVEYTDDIAAFGKLVEAEMKKIKNPKTLRKVKKEIFSILMDGQDLSD